MTITDNGRVEVDGELLAKGRELAKGGKMPSKRELQRHLGKGWDTVNAVLTTLTDEHRQAKAARRREALRQLTPRKRSEVLPVRRRDRQRTVNEPGAAPDPAPMIEDILQTLPLTVEKHTAPAAEPVSDARHRRPKSWPVYLLGFGATVAIWSGWVDMGRLTGFGLVHPFPGIPGLDEVELNAAITLPFGMETYGAYALYVWLSGQVPARARARRFARASALGALVLGALGQVAYHLMIAAGWTRAPWPITTLVACLPVAVLGMGAALRHLVHAEEA
jgi:hypothetical protein